MRKRRAEYFSERIFVELLQENTYGGNKNGEGKHAKRQRKEMPQICGMKGIKIEYGKDDEQYPVFVSLKMTNGEWVKYEIHRDQPAPVISPALEAVANMSRGSYGKWL